MGRKAHQVNSAMCITTSHHALLTLYRATATAPHQAAVCDADSLQFLRKRWYFYIVLR
jgi:hypothetical protein